MCVCVCVCVCVWIMNGDLSFCRKIERRKKTDSKRSWRKIIGKSLKLRGSWYELCAHSLLPQVANTALKRRLQSCPCCHGN